MLWYRSNGKSRLRQQEEKLYQLHPRSYFMRCSNKKNQVQVYHSKMLNSRKENETRKSNTSLHFPVRSLFPPGCCSAQALSCVAPSVRIFLSHLWHFVQDELKCFLPTTSLQFSLVIRGSCRDRQVCKI